VLGRDNPSKLIIATFLETGSIEQTATSLNYSFSWTYRVLDKFGVINRKPRTIKKICKTLTSKESSNLVSDYLSGQPTKLILSKYNISSTTLYLILNRNKIIGRKRKTGFSWNKLSIQDKAYLSANVICLAQENKSLQQIAKELELPLSRVRLILNNFTNRGASR
jgi:DNA invertase Pin-like site-specific DNA recombinase